MGTTHTHTHARPLTWRREGSHQPRRNDGAGGGGRRRPAAGGPAAAGAAAASSGCGGLACSRRGRRHPGEGAARAHCPAAARATTKIFKGFRFSLAFHKSSAVSFQPIWEGSRGCSVRRCSADVVAPLHPNVPTAPVQGQDPWGPAGPTQGYGSLATHSQYGGSDWGALSLTNGVPPPPEAPRVYALMAGGKGSPQELQVGVPTCSGARTAHPSSHDAVLTAIKVEFPVHAARPLN